jgi:hypothetical protein
MVNIAQFRTFNAIAARSSSQIKTGMIGTKMISQYWSPGRAVADLSDHQGTIVSVTDATFGSEANPILGQESLVS